MTSLVVYPLLLPYTTFIFFPISHAALELRESSWQVIRVVKPDEIGRPDRSLREQIVQLKFSFQEGENTLTYFSHTCTPDAQKELVSEEEGEQRKRNKEGEIV